MAKKEEKVVKEKNKENRIKKHFFKDFKAELKKVIWPTPKQLVNNTVAVVVIVAIVGAIVFVLDAVFEAMNKYGITELQSYVVEKFEKDEEKSSSENDKEESSNEETNQDTTDDENSTESNQ